jgi:tetrahydromethanopterin S-methyltransferase subunit F
MTSGEQRVFTRGVAAGTITGIAIGLIIALFIALKPEFLAALTGYSTE